MYFYFLLFVDVDVDQDLIGIVGIVFLGDDDIGILETFVVKVTLYQRLSAVYQVRCNLITFNQTYSGFQILTFRFLHAVITDIGNTRTHCQMYCKPNLVALDFIRCDLYIREQTVTPITFTSLRYLITGYGNGLAF